MKFSSVLVGAVAVLTAGLSGISASHASLIGTSVTLNYDYYTPANTVDLLKVGPGPEVSCTGGGGGNANVCSLLNLPSQSVDIGASSIRYSHVGTGGQFTPSILNGFDFENLNPGFTIGNVILTTNIANLDASRLSFTGSSVKVDMEGLFLTTTRNSPDFFNLGLTSAVPEPSTWAMMILGFAGIGLMAFRQRRKSSSLVAA
jgi:hypothetical protein